MASIVQNLSRPADNTQFIVGNTYTISFYNPYTMYTSSWWEASDNVIKVYYRNAQGEHVADLKTQVIVKGNNVFAFKLADYDLPRDNTYGIGVQINARVFGSEENSDSLYFDSPYVGSYEYPAPIFYTDAGAPTSPKLAETVSREAVELSWGAGSDGTGNSVTGYDVQYRESSDGSSWGNWTTASGSPVTGTKLNVAPSGTVGNYRQYRVRTRGSAGSDYYSDWATSTNTLRRKWNAFGAWTDATLTAGVSGIRAVHLTQLQERVAVIRAFYGMAAYSFTAVTARKTKIAKWAALVGEIRNAIDGITTNHEAWNTLQAGKPRIAHITQLRKIIDEM